MVTATLNENVTLTSDEYQVLKLVKNGYTVEEVASELNLSFWQARRLFRKLRDQQLINLTPTDGGRLIPDVTVDLRKVRKFVKKS